jgi:hypothetical protein
MRFLRPAIRAILVGYTAYLVLFLAFGYEPTDPQYRPPVVITVLDIVNLFIHEAGHFFFRPFGMFVHLLGGSLVQVLLPVALLVVTLRASPSNALYAGFWAGESLVNVSVYILDAPFRRLRLISRGALHDWHWLLDGDPDLARYIGTPVYLLGMLIALGATLAGAYSVIVTLRTTVQTPTD